MHFWVVLWKDHIIPVLVKFEIFEIEHILTENEPFENFSSAEAKIPILNRLVANKRLVNAQINVY